jgi:hypothetical protein
MTPGQNTRLIWGAAISVVAVLGLGGVVIAEGQRDVADEGAGDRAAMRYAEPRRDGPPVVVDRGVTADGRGYVIRASRSAVDTGGGRELCLEVSMPNSVPGADVTISGDEACFVAPETGAEIAYATSEVPAGEGKTRRTVYGYVSQSAARVKVVGRTRTTVVETTKIPDAPADVYLATLPADESPEGIVITSEDNRGNQLGRAETRFAGASR